MTTNLAMQTATAEAFKAVFRGHPAGIGIVTADAGDGPVAMTVSSLFSVGIEPPTLVFSTSALSSASPTIRTTESLVVHLVTADQLELAKLGATSGVDRFDGVEWGRLETGEPYYKQVASWMRCRVADRLEVAGSVLIVAEVLEAHIPECAEGQDLRPLVYHNRTWHALGESTVIE